MLMPYGQKERGNCFSIDINALRAKRKNGIYKISLYSLKAFTLSRIRPKELKEHFNHKVIIRIFALLKGQGTFTRVVVSCLFY